MDAIEINELRKHTHTSQLSLRPQLVLTLFSYSTERQLLVGLSHNDVVDQSIKAMYTCNQSILKD